MSGEFGEDFKPAKGADLGKESSSEKHDPFAQERTLKASDTAKPEEKQAEVKKTPDTVAAAGEKASFKEGTGKDYSDWLAENRTPAENAAALEKSLLAAVEKMAKLTQAGMGDVVNGGSYLAGLVNDTSGDDVRKFMATIKNYLEK